MSEQKPEKKVVGRTVAIVLGIICIVLVGALVGVFAYLVPMVINQTEPYVHSQLLHYPPVNISSLSSVGGWVMNWTPPTNVRVIRIQVWMGNPINVTWEGDTYVTIGKPTQPNNASCYNNTIQLLVHYQFDSHAPSPIPHQLMFDLTPGFEVVSAQTIYIYRDFVNFEPHNVAGGDVQIIIYYENT
jgi:type IV secretory pathway component VirB8